MEKTYEKVVNDNSLVFIPSKSSAGWHKRNILLNCASFLIICLFLFT